MIKEMVNNMNQSMEFNKVKYEEAKKHIVGDAEIYHGDCVEVARSLDDNSIDYSIFSPPFSSLYVYSNSERDMGNSKNDDEFATHFKFLIKELYRILRKGRLVSIHCMNIPSMKERDGFIGLKDFRGDIIRWFQDEGFIFHSETCIWKDPLTEATRTKALGLMHKQLCKDSTMCRSGIPDYLVTMRKQGDNENKVCKPNGMTQFVGENEPTKGVLSHEIWRRYASPVWMDINQSRTLQKGSARDEKDERHICPLQLDVIERGVHLWTNEKDTVFSPFMGIGSEGYISLQNKRKFVGSELKESYFNQALKNLDGAQMQMTMDLGV
jgi:DNA modification methylase